MAFGVEINDSLAIWISGMPSCIIGVIIANIRTVPAKDNATKTKVKDGLIKNAGIGGLVGFISGMVGIGGGIFLAPFLHISRWDIPKKIAATSSLFILVNSLSGLLGQYLN